MSVRVTGAAAVEEDWDVVATVGEVVVVACLVSAYASTPTSATITITAITTLTALLKPE